MALKISPLLKTFLFFRKHGCPLRYIKSNQENAGYSVNEYKEERLHNFTLSDVLVVPAYYMWFACKQEVSIQLLNYALRTSCMLDIYIYYRLLSSNVVIAKFLFMLKVISPNGGANGFNILSTMR